MKEILKKTVFDNVKKKRAILFGASVVAFDFYEKYKKSINILCCVSNKPSEWGEKVFMNELDVYKFDSSKLRGDEYFIVCGPYAFKEIEKQLLSCGLKPFEDFMVSSIVGAIIEDKKICMFRGSCILRDVYECIKELPEFNSKFTAIYSTDNYAINKTEDRVFFYGKDICDAYFYSYRVLRQYKEYLWTKEEIAKDAKICSISNVSYAGYWPQADPEIRNTNRYLVHPYNIKRDLVFYHTVYRMEDKEINNMIDKGLNAEQIYEKISDENYFSEKEVLRNNRKALKSVDIGENKADIKIGDYIKENYRDFRIFQNFSHMHKSVIWELVRRVLFKLEIEDKNVREYEIKSPKYIHHGGDIPIYPSVIKGLGLKMVDTNTKYEIMTYNGIKMMDLREYVNHYYEYTILAKRLIESW